MTKLQLDDPADFVGDQIEVTAVCLQTQLEIKNGSQIILGDISGKNKTKLKTKLTKPSKSETGPVTAQIGLDPNVYVFV